MNNKTRMLLVIFFLLVAQLACSSPFSGQNGTDPQHPGPIYTLTSFPPFPTATVTEVPSATPRPSPTATITSRPTPTRTATLPVTLTSAPNLRPIAPVIARYRSTPPKLDGDWSEWKGLTEEYPANTVVWGKKKWTGADDLAAAFHLGWDEEYLYLAIKVRDAQYVQNTTGANLYNGDSLELLLDSQLMEDYESARLSEDDFQLGLSAGHPHPGAKQEAYLWAPRDLAGPQKTIKIEARQEPGIYRVEVAIPWKVFKMTPAADQHYGFAISVSDNDDGDGSVQQSMVSNLSAHYPADPTTWGDLQLVK